MAEEVGKIGNLVEEITSGSQEQSQGIDQINRAIMEMNKVVQQGAASAEESASASEEMCAQSEQMKSYVEGLAALIGGNGHSGSTKKQTVSSAGKLITARRLEPRANSLDHPAKMISHHAAGSETRTKDQINLKGDEFKDF